MNDEPLSEWAERRYAKVGRLRAIPLVTGDGPKGSHLNPDAPRAIRCSRHQRQGEAHRTSRGRAPRAAARVRPPASGHPASMRVERDGTHPFERNRPWTPSPSSVPSATAAN
ncbi:DUF6087 family protein [Streptomyces sp. NPDC021749]|uniref:DUF6087 family protein n=1 Tax=Streptomyces sp. NPDC021749 TaxID=3154905 RepID=UPI0033CFBBE6